MDTWKNFVENLTRVEAIRKAKEQAIQEWGDDIPTTLLFAKLGRAVADVFDVLSCEERVFVFELIERGMGAAEGPLREFMATGLLEGLNAQASGTPELARQIDAQLGEASRQYLIEWRKWTS